MVSLLSAALAVFFDAEVLAAAFTVFFAADALSAPLFAGAFAAETFAVLAAELFAVLDAFSLAVLETACFEAVLLVAALWGAFSSAAV